MLTPLAEKKLTPREAQVLNNILRGDSHPLIARKLGISIKTVEKHRAQLNDRFDAHNPAELVVNSIRRGYVNIPVDIFPT